MFDAVPLAARSQHGRRAAHCNSLRASASRSSRGGRQIAPCWHLSEVLMALHHAQPGEVVALHCPEGVAAERSVALFKARDLEVLRLSLRTGEALPPHRVAGDITVQCLAGALEVGLPGQRVRLQAGELVYVPGEVAHDVRAVQDAAALVTIALRSGGLEGPAPATSGSY
jgi:quercetin dioxygenase-like cupin family protein